MYRCHVSRHIVCDDTVGLGDDNVYMNDTLVMGGFDVLIVTDGDHEDDMKCNILHVPLLWCTGYVYQ